MNADPSFVHIMDTLYVIQATADVGVPAFSKEVVLYNLALELEPVQCVPGVIVQYGNTAVINLMNNLLAAITLRFPV